MEWVATTTESIGYPPPNYPPIIPLESSTLKKKLTANRPKGYYYILLPPFLSIHHYHSLSITINYLLRNPPAPPWRWRRAYWGAHSNTKCSMTFVNIAVAISALAGGGAKNGFAPRPGDNVSTDYPIIYSGFCSLCSKTSFFYRVSGPSAAQNCTLAMLKNVGFSTVFAWRGGKNRKKLSLKMFST